MALKYTIIKSTKYKRDCKAAAKSGLDIEKLELVVRLLAADIPLPPKTATMRSRGTGAATENATLGRTGFSSTRRTRARLNSSSSAQGRIPNFRSEDKAMSKMKLPTVKAIMAENNCTAEAAESIRARLEVEADRAHFRKTGKHLLSVVEARDLERHPELAVQDTIRPKLTAWNIQDCLKTAEDRATYIFATAEGAKTPDALPHAFADVFRSIGKPAEAAACEGLAAYLRTVGGASRRTARRKATRREPAYA